MNQIWLKLVQRIDIVGLRKHELKYKQKAAKSCKEFGHK